MMETVEPQCNVVPWHSKSEWNDVFEKIYSNDLTLQNEAFQKMCIWKIRCSKLPVGVECTMEILQVHLFSKKCDETSFAHKDLQLMYSTTIMRFVNQLTHIYGKKMNMSLTCYKIAEICKIPDWIVNIRHEAAHSNLLPCIELLELAAAFVLEWLHNNYWIPEAKHASDLVIKEIVLPEATERKLKVCLNLWQACKLYKYANRHTIGEIPNSSLRLHLLSLQKRKNILNDDKTSENLSDLLTLESYLINDGTCGKSAVKVSAVLTFLNSYLTTLFPRNAISDYHSENVFVKSLIDCELFLPTMYDHTFYSDGHSLRGSLSSLWREVLEIFHKAQLLANLIQKLADISVKDTITSRRLVAACWISHLSESLCTPSDEIDVFVELRENSKYASFFLKKDEYAVGDIEKVLSRNVLRNLNLSKNVILNNHILENTVNEVTMSPNIYTIIFLSRLLDLLNPPLDQAAKDGIIQLVKVYTKTEECISTSDTIYTADMLLGFNLCESKSESEEKYEEIGSQSKSIWSKKHGVYDWSKYPLGQLPQVL